MTLRQAHLCLPAEGGGQARAALAQAGQVYTHVLQRGGLAVKSPLDD